MKVYGWIEMAGADARQRLPEPDQSSARQMRVIVKAPSQKALRERYGLSHGFLREHVCDTGNTEELALATEPFVRWATWIDWPHKYVRLDD